MASHDFIGCWSQMSEPLPRLCSSSMILALSQGRYSVCLWEEFTHRLAEKTVFMIVTLYAPTHRIGSKLARMSRACVPCLHQG